MATQAEQQSFEKLAKAESTLVEKVAYPAFFEKCAAAGITPADQKVAQELLTLSDVVAPAVGRAVQRYLAADATGQFNALKAASDVTKSLAGITHGQPEPSTASTFLEDADVKFAAAAVVAEQIKQANLSNLLNMAPPKTPEEEEEEAKKKQAPVA